MRTVLTNGSVICSLMLLIAPIYPAAGQDVLEHYITEGIASNLVLKRRHVSLEKATYGLRMAKSMFLPAVSLQAGYQTADGGRNIPLPVGDLLNPVYRTLNQLTQSDQFPYIENETINFLPRNYYDAHV